MKLGEKVLVIFTRQADGYFEGNLVDYANNAFMNFKDATKRRNVNSWSQIVPLNKEMVVVIEDIDKSGIIQVSLAYFDDKKFKDMTEMQIQQELLIPFNENKLLKKFINSFVIQYNYDYDATWNTFIDNLKLSYEEEIDDEDISLWKYFNNNFDTIIKNLNMDEVIIEQISELFNKKNNEVVYDIVSKIGIISLGGVNQIKELINKVKPSYNFTLKYDSAPYYIFTTKSNETTEDTHNTFINQLDLESQNIIPRVFIKKY